jgi:hypothetical protein
LKGIQAFHLLMAVLNLSIQSALSADPLTYIHHRRLLNAKSGNPPDRFRRDLEW